MIQIKPAVEYGQITTNSIEENIVGENILIVCSKTVWNKSYLKDIINNISEKYKIKVYTHVRPNAPFTDLQKILDENSNSKPTSIIAIGGGSVIDACKALSVSFSKASISDLFYKKVAIPKTSIQLIAIPTTAGTGAELSFGAIIYDDVNCVKGGLRGEIIQPNVVFIDAKLYQTAPKKLIAEVGFDCLTHAIETYISVKSCGVTEYQSLSAIKTVLECLPKAVNGEIDGMKQMSIASAMMGINLAYSSTCLPHRIQYIIGPLTNTSHAQGLIALYKGWLPLISQNKLKSKLNQLEIDLGGKIDLVDEINQLKEDLNLDYSITSLGVKQNQIEKIAMETNGSLKNDPIFQDKKTIIKILEKAL